MNKNQILPAYFHEWMAMYKLGAVRAVTYKKYELTYRSLKQLAPKLRLGSVSRIKYQELLNAYAQTHEKQTVMDFHHLVKSAILDVVDEGILANDPTRKVVIKGTQSRLHKPKFLNLSELQQLLQHLQLNSEINWD